MIDEELNIIECELKKRFNLPYEWGRKQNDTWDKFSAFIYETRDYNLLLKRSDEVSAELNINRKDFLNYASNRWYNFWSAFAVEKIFATLPGVVPAYNSRNRMVDFILNGKNFDHKTSIFPKAFPKNLDFARQNPRELISWLYENQSSQQRQHFENRLFLIVFAKEGQHWKIKAEITFLKKAVQNYMLRYDPSQLLKFEFKPGKTTFSDIIWAIK